MLQIKMSWLGDSAIYYIMLFIYLNNVLDFFFYSEDGEEAMNQDTDSDVAEAKDCGKVKIKWTQEEVRLPDSRKSSMLH